MASFYNIDLQIDANFDTNSIPPFSTIATNFQIQTDEGISLLWTNNELGNSNELEAIIEADSTGHSYLVGSVVTSGATGTYSCDVPNTNGLTFMRYWAPASSPGDQFFVLSNTLNNMDIFTVPYIAYSDAFRTAIRF